MDIAKALKRFVGGIKGRFAADDRIVSEQTEKREEAVHSLGEGYSAHEVPGGKIYISEPSEAGYFASEDEFAPTISAAKPLTLAEANAPRSYGRVRFEDEDPADEFINAVPRAPKTEVDYSIFTVRSSRPVEKVVEVPAVSVVEPVISEVPVVETPVVEAVVEAPAVEPVVEVAPVEVPMVIETVPVEAPVVIETPVAESVAEAPIVVAEAEAPVVVEAPVAEIEDEPIVELTPAEEIEALTPRIAGMPEMALTSAGAVCEPATFHCGSEAEVIGAFDSNICDDAIEMESFEIDLPIVDDEVEKVCFADVEAPAVEAKPVVEAPVVEAVVEAPAEVAPAESVVEEEPAPIVRHRVTCNPNDVAAILFG